ncbi:MAG: PAS domain S-box protein [Thermodesulfobacteriota bacterium]|nr:PAS domain S-box protein [Thermodesulfobacteriota bacterium]
MKLEDGDRGMDGTDSMGGSKINRAQAVKGRGLFPSFRKLYDKRRATAVGLLTAFCIGITAYFHGILHSEAIFVHFYYLPIVLAALFWGKKGVGLALFLAAYFLWSHRFVWERPLDVEDWVRVSLLVGIGFAVAALSERLKGVQRELVLSRTRYSEMFRHMSEGVAVYKTVDDGRSFVIVDMNEAAELLDGVSKKEVLGKDVTAVFPAIETFGLLDVFRRVWESGKPQNHPVRFYTGRRMSGWRENYVYRLPSGEVVAVYTDRSREKLAEEKLLELASIVEFSNDAILSIDLNGTVRSWNPAAERIYGYSAEEMEGRSILTLVPPDYHEEVFGDLERIKNGERLEHHESVRITRDGRRLHVSVTISPVKDAEGRIVGISNIARDITQQKQMAAALERARVQLERRVEERTRELAQANEELRAEIARREEVEEALRESSEKIKIFAYSVAHDLKSPAIGIYGLANLLARKYSDRLDEKGRAVCSQILKASEQVAALVDKINLFIASKESPLNIESLRVKELFEMIREEFSLQLGLRQIGWCEPDTEAEILADRLAMIRIFRNLVDNALKYGGESLTEIRLGYQASAGLHVLTIADNGAGIRGENAERIFGLFHREGNTGDTLGTGLGLAIVKELAERHGGRVWVESQEGRGTTFFVALPKD